MLVTKCSCCVQAEEAEKCILTLPQYPLHQVYSTSPLCVYSGTVLKVSDHYPHTMYDANWSSMTDRNWRMMFASFILKIPCCGWSLWAKLFTPTATRFERELNCYKNQSFLPELKNIYAQTLCQDVSRTGIQGWRVPKDGGWGVPNGTEISFISTANWLHQELSLCKSNIQ